jgi:small GTP-binding protein
MNSSSSNFSVDSADLKIAVLGKSLVGKSALTYRFINDKFPEEHDTTIEDQYTLPIEIEGIQCKLEILDTAGQDDCQSMLDTWINSVDGVI